MADAVRKVEYFSINVPNKPGKAFGVLSSLVSSGIDLLACVGVPRGNKAQIDVVPDDTGKFKRAVKKAGLTFTAEKSGFLIQGRDRPGALTQHLKKLGDSDINVTGIDSMSAGDGRWGAIIWVEDAAVRRASQLLGAGAAAPARRKAPASKTRGSKASSSKARGAKARKAPVRKTRKKR